MSWNVFSTIVLSVKGIKIRPDPLPFRNDKRRDFCSRYDGYGDFCSGKQHRPSLPLLLDDHTFLFADNNVDKNLAPVPLLNRTLEDNPTYSTPILVIAGRCCRYPALILS